MSLDYKGKRLLRESNYSKFRDQLIKDIAESINISGVHGDRVIEHISNVLQDEKYDAITRELIDKIKEKMDLDKEYEAEDALMVILQEDVCSELHKNLYTHPEKLGDLISEGLYKKGKRRKIWEDVQTRKLGKKTSVLGDLMILLSKHSIIRWTLILGVTLQTVSSILLRSVYKSVLAGLTLKAEPGESFRIMMGNVIGALGGILLFFVFVSLLIQDKYLARKRDERLRRLADKTVKEKFERW